MTSYLISEAGIWVDIPEARPRVRARLKQAGDPAELTVSDEGVIEHGSRVQIDTYQGAKYADVRAENDKAWAEKDRIKKRKDDKQK